jgi:cytochrome P450
MNPSAEAWHCSFDHAHALEFDPLLKRLLAEAPIARIRMPYGEGEAWLVTRYDDVRFVTADRRFSRSAGIGRNLPRMTPDPIAQAEAINLMDPPAHTRLRRLVAKEFTNRRVEQMRDTTQRITGSLLDDMAGHGAPADLVCHLSARLPLITICEILDIPGEDRPRLAGWASAMMTTGTHDRQAAGAAKSGLRAYFAELTARRRRAPGTDLLSALALARDGGEFLDIQDLAVMGTQLLLTGQDPSTGQISNIAYTLLTCPQHLARMRAEPELLPRAIEELLRFIPFRRGVGIPRIATEDVTIDAVRIGAGEAVHVSYLAANRDPRTFARPDELDLDRGAAHHMAFGSGTHHCAGAHLARMELQVAIAALLNRFPRLALAVPASAIEWNTKSIWRYPLALPVTW